MGHTCSSGARAVVASTTGVARKGPGRLLRSAQRRPQRSQASEPTQRRPQRRQRARSIRVVASRKPNQPKCDSQQPDTPQQAESARVPATVHTVLLHQVATVAIPPSSASQTGVAAAGSPIRSGGMRMAHSQALRYIVTESTSPAFLGPFGCGADQEVHDLRRRQAVRSDWHSVRSASGSHSAVSAFARRAAQYDLVAEALYLPATPAAVVLADLHATGILVADGEAGGYRYQPQSDDLTALVERLAGPYPADMVGIAGLIHDAAAAEHTALRRRLSLAQGK